MKIAVLASSYAPLKCDWFKLLDLSCWLADKIQSRSDWWEGSYSPSRRLRSPSGQVECEGVWFGGFTVQCGHYELQASLCSGQTQLCDEIVFLDKEND